MTRKFVPVAIAYDFDGSLSPGNMQEYKFVPNIGMTPRKFWNDANQQARQNDADGVLTYMNLMLKKANETQVLVRKVDFEQYGRSVKLFKGVNTWFDRINKYGKKNGLKIEHYIISSGIHEIISGTLIAKKFKRIYASSFVYDQHGVAKWPALAINYTTKTQYLFRINKGALNVWDDSKINAYVPKDQRPIPFGKMIFIGDGSTDIPCFSLVKSQGGHSIAVYKPNTKNAKAKANKLIDDERVNFVVPADYSDGSAIDEVVKAILGKIASDIELAFLGKHD